MQLRTRLVVLWLTTLIAALGTVGPSAASTRWAHRAGKQLDDVAVDTAGNTYATGWTLTGSGDSAAILVKFGPAGSKLWSRIWFPAAAGLSWGTAVAVAPDGSVYWGGGVTIPGCEGDGWFLRKLSSDGRLRWHRDQPGWQQCRKATVLSDIDASPRMVVFAATDHGCCGDPFGDGYVRAFTPAGGRRWVAPFEPPPAVPHRFFDRATGVAISGLDRVFVAGTAATERVSLDQSPPPSGLVVVEKVAPSGRVLWARGAVRVPYFETQAAVAVRSDRLMLATRARGGYIGWGGKPPAAWLGRFTVGGDFVWSRVWGRKWRFGAEPSAVSIDAGLATWVVGTRRDPTDRGLDLFVRRFSGAGRLTWSTTLDGPTRYLHGTGIAARAGVYASGWVGSERRDEVSTGRLVRFDVP